VQWQYDADTNGSVTSYRTAPQPQPPVMGISATTQTYLPKPA
jgi:hypothetical protein